jgi:hypothetical protein
MNFRQHESRRLRAAANQQKHSPAMPQAVTLPFPGERRTSVLEQIAANLARIANHFDPPPPDIVDTTYIADKLDCTLEWVAKMALRGQIPGNCIVQGTGRGKPWKFHRSQIDRWIEMR